VDESQPTKCEVELSTTCPAPWFDERLRSAPPLPSAAKDTGSVRNGPSLAAHQVELVWQPVRDARDGEAVLYHEALVRCPDLAGLEVGPRVQLMELERRGDAPAFDRAIVRRVIAELEADPLAVLAVNISARSVDPAIWCDVFARLRRNPAVARRLVIEITETAPLPSLEHALSFSSQARALGCRVALDDFGVGHTSLYDMFAMQPAIIKIDALFVRRAGSGGTADAMFRHLVGLARSTNALVVVEGVETPLQAELALEAGAIWQQGFYHGRPSGVRCHASASRGARFISRLPFRVADGSSPL